LAEVKNSLVLESHAGIQNHLKTPVSTSPSVVSVTQTKNSLTGRGQDCRLDGPE